MVPFAKVRTAGAAGMPVAAFDGHATCRTGERLRLRRRSPNCLPAGQPVVAAPRGVWFRRALTTKRLLKTGSLRRCFGVMPLPSTRFDSTACSQLTKKLRKTVSPTLAAVSIK